MGSGRKHEMKLIPSESIADFTTALSLLKHRLKVMVRTRLCIDSADFPQVLIYLSSLSAI